MGLEDSFKDNKRIAKNSLMLYIRMFLVMGVTFYTSRVILEYLGVVDYGIYDLIGGIVTLFTFLNATMSGATSRFLTYELGKGDERKLKEIFSALLTVHIGIALFVFLLAETVGLWFVNVKLVIPEDRLFAANIVYQFSILSCMLSITQVPYTAAIIAHEKMEAYALVSIVNVVIKLLIVFLLPLIALDSLIFYAFLICLATLVITFAYRFYCFRYFSECAYHFSIKNRALYYPMLRFSAWDLYGNLCVMANGQGLNILINMFGGPALNAASAISAQVRGGVSAFVSGFTTAVRPQIVKRYAADNKDDMLSLLYESAKYSYLLILLISIPFLYEMDFILNIWLKNVPAYSAAFCRLSILLLLVDSLFSTCTMGLHATGKIKLLSLVRGTIFLLSVPVAYVCLSLGYSPTSVYIVNLIVLSIAYFTTLLLLKKEIPEVSIVFFFQKVILKIVPVTCITVIVVSSFADCMETGWIRLIVIVAVSTGTIALLTYWIVMNKQMRGFIVSYIGFKNTKV